MNILFICMHNRYRSKTAEAIFLKLNKNRNIKVKSAGAHLELFRRYVSENVKSVLKDKGYKVKSNWSHSATEKLKDWADKIVIVADDVNQNEFPKSKREVWKIKDCHQWDVPAIEKGVSKIEGRVKRLVWKLRKVEN